MMLSRLLVSVALSAALVQGTAFAQSGTGAADKSNLNQSAQSLPQELKQKLENQGFSDVQVVPGSFIVSAKDKDGDPVNMVIGPNSLTMFTISSASSSSGLGSSSETTGSGSSTMGSGSDAPSDSNK
jgi:hypothetical protein